MRLYLLVWMIPVAAGGCGSSSPPSSSDQDVVASSDVRGTYIATSEGAIGAIEFTDQGGYALAPTGCSARSCAELGTYTLDPARTTLSLTEAKTGRARTLPFAILATSPAGTVATKDDGLTTPGQSVTTSGGSTVVTPGPSLTIVDTFRVETEILTRGAKGNEDGFGADGFGGLPFPGIASPPSR